MALQSRVFTTTRRVRVGDSNSEGELRIDALARYLQDIGFDDTNDIGVGDGGIWVARSISMKFITPDNLPKRNEEITLCTYCNGIGKASAQRNVDIVNQNGSSIETQTIWVHLGESGKPTPVPQWLFDAYPQAQKITSKRNLELLDVERASADSEIEVLDWNFRASDYDINNHINNAVAFDALYEIADKIKAKRPYAIAVEYHQPLGDVRQAKLFYKLKSSGFAVWMANGNNISSSMQWSYA